MWFCYGIVHSHTQKQYIGITNNLANRLKKHNQNKGAKATRTRCGGGCCWSYLWTWQVPENTRGAAQSWEAHFKKKARKRKRKRKRKSP